MTPAGQPSLWRAVLSGACAALIGIGVARFAYTPLLPAVVSAGWFSSEAAAYLAAANLGGYLAGVLLAERFAARLSAVTTLRAAMVISTGSLLACAFQAGFNWFFLWRFASGVAGGVIMVLAAPLILAHAPPARRGLIGGFIFMGIGLGIAASGTLVPLLLRQGVGQAWIGLAVTTAMLTAVAWGGWPNPPAPAPAPAKAERHSRRPPRHRLTLLHFEYALNAVGLVPHMVFLAVFVAHGLNQGVDAAGFYWVLFGLGALVGPLVFGHLADRAGHDRALRLVLLLEAAATLAPAVWNAPAALACSSLFMGAATPGIVPVVLGRAHELAGSGLADQRAAWRIATTGFAAAQAVAAYGLAFVLSASQGAYGLIFALGAGALLLAFLIDVVGEAVVRPRTRRA
ncbi:YbfB/YjiJ family MFS transporter [Caulobacter sp. 602-1]|uniref:YbfB/YjiJ family MFS transporter n=1 Tax=Caulobacter sp. 602-1 TaxID=2492472 RepID=UPI000F64427A|nr:YbfB/YjiJ family MFS transporter [Caulobacter sp. 602-1]RRN63979.1 YbfB/YjiJ family MFS transporter [Caulobacter sp. 602-1]